MELNKNTPVTAQQGPQSGMWGWVIGIHREPGCMWSAFVFASAEDAVRHGQWFLECRLESKKPSCEGNCQMGVTADTEHPHYT